MNRCPALSRTRLTTCRLAGLNHPAALQLFLLHLFFGGLVGASERAHWLAGISGRLMRQDTAA